MKKNIDNPDEKGLSYSDSGVDIDRADRAILRIKNMVRSTYTEGVPSDIGGFAGFFRPDLTNMKKPVLVSSTDGVGTKLLIAQKMKKYDTVGIDLVAMIVNDIICVGAKPLFLLDYIGIGKFEDEVFEDIIKGIVEGCKQAECALIGGETAELPDMYPPGEFDLAAFGVGIVDEKRVVDGSGIREGDVILGLPSSGFHSNGYSLVRKVVETRTRQNYSDYVPELDMTLGEALLTPTTIFVKPIMALLDKAVEIQGIANITGGGITNNIPRILPNGLSARIDSTTWKVPPVIDLIVKWGNIERKERYKVFNMGIGTVLVMRGGEIENAQKILKEHGIDSIMIGDIVPGKNEVILTNDW